MSPTDKKITEERGPPYCSKSMSQIQSLLKYIISVYPNVTLNRHLRAFGLLVYNRLPKFFANQWWEALFLQRDYISPFKLERSLVKMGHSTKCPDLKTYWQRTKSQCVPCAFTPGREITPNCGYDDYGGRHELPSKPCSKNTFNDGSSAYCKNCTSCPPGFEVSPCNSTTDAQCRESSNWTTGVSSKISPTQESSIIPTTTVEALIRQNQSGPSVLIWAVPLASLVSIVLVLSVCAVIMKRKKGQHTVLSFNRRSSYISAGFSSLSAPPDNNDLEDILSPAILSAPLQTVLDNLDVLEELVILLDPERQGVKNTKHLASHCSFPSTWITYAYSMKDSKSPLRAVLEGVTSRHPEWTVGHLAKLLRLIERNDAVAALQKLRLKEMSV